jgi:hypothetical protein
MIGISIADEAGMAQYGSVAQRSVSGRRSILATLVLAALAAAMLLPVPARAAWKDFNFSANFYNEYGWCQAYGHPTTASAPNPGGCQGRAAGGPSPWTNGARLALDWSADSRVDVGVVKTVNISSNGGTDAASLQGYTNSPQWERMIVNKGNIPGFPLVATGKDWNQHPGWYNGALSVDMQYHQQWYAPKTSGYSIALQGWFGTP